MTVGFTIAAGEAGGEKAARLFPNPASSRLFVDWGGFDRLELFDAVGRLTFSKKKSEDGAAAPLDGLADGSYRAVFSKNGRESRPQTVIVRR